LQWLCLLGCTEEATGAEASLLLLALSVAEERRTRGLSSCTLAPKQRATGTSAAAEEAGLLLLLSLATTKQTACTCLWILGPSKTSECASACTSASRSPAKQALLALLLISTEKRTCSSLLSITPEKPTTCGLLLRLLSVLTEKGSARGASCTATKEAGARRLLLLGGRAETAK
jgi:hypothetical protein